MFKYKVTILLFIILCISGCVMLYFDSPQTTEHNKVNTSNKGCNIDDERSFNMENDSVR